MLGKVLGQISIVITTIDDFVWGIPLIVLILSVGIYLTIRLKGLQITKMPMAIRHIRDNEKTGEHGEVSSFGALCTALSATIGTGNIVGVCNSAGSRRSRSLILDVAGSPAWNRNQVFRVSVIH